MAKKQDNDPTRAIEYVRYDSTAREMIIKYISGRKTRTKCSPAQYEVKRQKLNQV